MTDVISHPRADRLRREAANCLSIAVRERDRRFTAELIDEAIRLTRRARELAEAQDQKPAT